MNVLNTTEPCIARDAATEDRQVDGPSPAPSEPPPARTPLSTIPEEDSIVTEDSLFIHEDPNLQHSAYLAGLECLKCANDGDMRTDYEEPEESRVPPRVTDSVESLIPLRSLPLCAERHL